MNFREIQNEWRYDAYGGRQSYKPYKSIMSTKTIAVLAEECSEQRNSYRSRGKDDKPIDAESCAEIIRRSLIKDAEGKEALDLVMEISRPLVAARLYKKHDLRKLSDSDIGDIKQLVLEKISKRLLRSDPPFRVDTFSQYVRYLHLTVHSVFVDFINEVNERDSKEESIDNDPDEMDQHEMIQAQDDGGSSNIENQMLIKGFLEKCLTELERKVVLLRYAEGYKPKEIVIFLKKTHPNLQLDDGKDFYRLLENAMKKLRRCKELRKFFNDEVLS